MCCLKNQRLYYLLVGDSQVFDENIMFIKVLKRNRDYYIGFEINSGLYWVIPTININPVSRNILLDER